MLHLMLFFYLITGSDSLLPEVPWAKNDHFKYELDYSFKTKLEPQGNEVYLEHKTYKSDPLPYVKIKFTLFNLPDELTRFKLIDNYESVLRSKKLKGSVEFVIDMGFAVDIKERISAHSYSIIFYDDDKLPISKINVRFSEDGDMYVNEELKGKI